MPIPSPAAHAMPNDVKFASSAAASAGTMTSGSTCASSWVSDAAMTPTPPATRLASSVFTIERRFGERPASMPLTSFSEAARVARPKRVKRYRAQSTIADAMTMPAMMNRLDGIGTSKTVIVPSLKMVGADLLPVPNSRSIPACAVSSTPSEATSLASGDAVRSGRNATSSMSAPNAIVMSSVRISAGTSAMPLPISPVFSAQNVNPPTIATAPVARLMIPEPR